MDTIIGNPSEGRGNLGGWIVSSLSSALKQKFVWKKWKTHCANERGQLKFWLFNKGYE